MNLKWEQGRFYFEHRLYIRSKCTFTVIFLKTFGLLSVKLLFLGIGMMWMLQMFPIYHKLPAVPTLPFLLFFWKDIHFTPWWRQHDVTVRSWWRHNIKWFTDSFPAFNVFKLYAVGCNWKVRWFEKSTSNATSQPRLSWFSCDNTW